MKNYTAKIAQFFQIDFRENTMVSKSSEDIRRIKMVAIISLIGMLNLLLYAIIYSFIDFSSYIIPISFYFFSAVLTIGIIVINKQGYFNFAKILLVLIFPFYLTINSTILFGKVANSQVYILLFSLIPVFVWSFKEKGYMLFFIGFDLLIYSIIEFFPPITEPLFSIPTGHVEHFKSLNTFVAFLGVFIAIIYFQKFSNQIEQKLVEQTIELKNSQIHRDLIYSIIAHDLRNPFNGLMGLTDVLIKQFDELPTDKVKKYISALNASALALNSLLVNLLDWSKMHSGNLKMNREPVKIKQIVDDVAKLHKDLLDKKALQLSNEIDEDDVVLADMYMVSTITRNLLSNAIKYTHEGGCIEIKAKRLETFIEISVRDSGVGIPSNKIEALLCFQSNFNTPGTNNEKGSGLGLRICNDFVTVHGGRFWVESQANEGSCFYFTLPA